MIFVSELRSMKRWRPFFFLLKIFTRPHCGTLSVVNSPCVHRRGQGWIMLSNCFLILLIFLEFYFEMWIGRVRKVRDYIWKASQHCISSHIPICKKISRNWEPRVNFIIGPFSFQRCCSTSRRKWSFPMLQIFPSLNYKSNNKRWHGVFLLCCHMLLREKLFWNQSHVSRLGSVEARPWPRIRKINFPF